MDEARRLRLLNEWQHGFPLVDRPFAELGRAVGASEDEVLDAFRAGLAEGVVSRIGPVVAPRRVGASALAALAAPPERLAEVAAQVSARPEVNHNYEREHSLNLWFVLTAASQDALDAAVAAIAADTGLQPVVLPMVEAYHIDLGFDLCGISAYRSGRREPVEQAARLASSPPCALPGIEQGLLQALQRGLPIVPRPYEVLGERVELSGALVCAFIDEWLASGLLQRFGVVVRHHELGYTANAMCVWDVPDDRVSEIGHLLGGEAQVTLCYRRRRALPQWRYNLFCMIHGKARDEVLATRAGIAERLGLDQWPHEVLFSRRRFKQRGACYLPDPEPADV